jgi:hypothetical protein
VYDGYFGVNAATSLASITWKHWLTHETSIGGTPRVEKSTMPFQDYAWTMLNASAPWSKNFKSTGDYARHLVRFSLSGLPEKEDLAVKLDGKDIGWAPRKDIGVDRWHYDLYVDKKLAEGEHEVSFELKEKDREGRAQLCSVEVLEFGEEKEYVHFAENKDKRTHESCRFNATKGFYGAFPTYSDDYWYAYRILNNIRC